MLEKLLKITGKNKPERKNVALVLSSGGARGLAHIGAIEVLEEWEPLSGEFMQQGN